MLNMGGYCPTMFAHGHKNCVRVLRFCIKCVVLDDHRWTDSSLLRATTRRPVHHENVAHEYGRGRIERSVCAHVGESRNATSDWAANANSTLLSESSASSIAASCISRSCSA